MIFEYSGERLTLDISLKSGDLTFKAEDRKDIEIEFPGLRKNAADDIFDVSLENTVLKIRENKREKKFGIIILSPGKSGDNADVVIRYPEALIFDGSVVTYAGDLAANDLKFSGNCKTYSGDMIVDRMTTEGFKLEAYSGDVTIGTLDGALRLNSYSGDIIINGGTMTGLELNSYSGDCNINGALHLSTDGVIKSMSGDVTLKILAYTGDSQLFIQSLSGDTNVSGEYPDDKIVIKSLLKSMKFNPVKMFSHENNSDIEVEVDSTKKHVQRIVDMIDSGKITPEEGEKLIKAVKA